MSPVHEEPPESRAASPAAGAAPREGSEPETVAAPPLVRKTWVYHTLRTASRVAGRLLFSLRVEGREHLPLEGGVLLAANHASFLDIPLVSASTSRHVAFVARDTLAGSSLLGWIMRRCGAVLIRRGAADRRALDAIVAHLAAGDCVAVYPEGTRSSDGALGELKTGVLVAARRARVPVVPARIQGSFEAWSRHAKRPRRHPVTITFGERIDPRAPDALERLRAHLAGAPDAARAS